MSDEVELPDGIDESEREAWDAWLAYGYDADNVDGFRDAYAGTYYKVWEYVEEVVRDVEQIPSYLEYYIDWDSMARDWELNGDIWTESSTSGYHVFRNV